MTLSNLIGVFRKFPKELFRVNNGPFVKLRVWSPQRHTYDIFIEQGLVVPKALDPSSYVTPNGASMRPNSPYQQSLVSWRFRGDNTIVYAVPEGTRLPDHLLLVHERSDHYSLQPTTPMTVDDLNARITEFFRANAEAFTREQWLKAYPKATESSQMHRP
ncbi:hypothetical protein JDV02_000064 [Purpureocillium takamizusanense]|uniref:Tse2 ADP-ribosyltransferase toxin domain-containing protein n=1 Tax=Purpureocillium takamizusanense TaxID=2060973 RepID=A0A9Q8V603_9HYPO|nr:uncharacterized protein JDV02_000064 [Purpureocillium takamizusanense]UNI13307.1 hypothetical protein JDV02_000064 [Purpureocillium takamizusanense]